MMTLIQLIKPSLRDGSMDLSPQGRMKWRVMMTSKTAVEVNDDKIKEMNYFTSSVAYTLALILSMTGHKIENLAQRVRHKEN